MVVLTAAVAATAVDYMAARPTAAVAAIRLPREATAVRAVTMAAQAVATMAARRDHMVVRAATVRVEGIAKPG